MSANHPRIPAILLAEDGSPGQSSDDEVDVTTQISNNFSLLANLAGVVRFSTAAGKPSSNNYSGKVAQEIDTGNMFIYDGAQWQIMQSTTFYCTSATRPTAGSYTLYEGLQIFETDTKAIGIYSSGSWVIWDTQWQTYTPAWTSSGTQPVVGNGSIGGKYLRKGKSCELHIALLTGSTTTYGSGYMFSTPLPMGAVHASVPTVGTAWVINQGSWYLTGTVNVIAADKVSIFLPLSTVNNAQGQWTATSPWAFKNTDQATLHCHIPI